MIRVMIVAPRLVLRIGLREMLHNIQGVVVSGEAASPAERKDMDTEADVTLLASASADWFTMDKEFSGGNATLLLSDDIELARALRNAAGAWGILPSDPTPEELAAGIRALHAGLVILPAHLAARMLQETVRENAHPLDALAEALTAREGEILGLIAQGLANKQIAARLGISEHTVKFHISSLFAKLDANSRTEAVRLGTLQGLIVI